MGSNDDLTGCLVGAVSGAGLFFGGFKKLRTLRRIENTPTSRIRSMPMGSVEINGVAHMDDPLVSPFTGKPVVFYEVEIEQYQRTGKNASWVTIHKRSSEEPFHVVDDTGRALVLPDGAETHLPSDFVKTCSYFGKFSGRIEAYCEKQGIGRGFLPRGKLRVTERHIGLGDQVYVHGVAQERPDLWRAYSDSIRERIREIKSDPEQMKALDTNADGIVDDLEWHTAQRQVRAEVERNGVADRVAIAKGSSGELFFLSDRPEKDLVSLMRWRTFGSVWGGGALFVGCASYLLWRAKEWDLLGFL